MRGADLYRLNRIVVCQNISIRNSSFINPICVQSASQVLGFPTFIDLGPAPNGGRYYCDLLTGLHQEVDYWELRAALEDALKDFFKERAADLQPRLQSWIEDQRSSAYDEAETPEADNRGAKAEGLLTSV